MNQYLKIVYFYAFKTHHSHEKTPPHPNTILLLPH